MNGDGPEHGPRSGSVWTRRRLVRAGAAGAVAGAGALAGPLPTRHAWATRGDARRSLRIAYLTDVHATPKWNVPDALPRAAAVINETGADLMLCGGDLIHGGLAARPPEKAPHWDLWNRFADGLECEVRPALGNNDLVGVHPADGGAPEADPRGPFRNHTGLAATNYRFAAAGYHILVLDLIHRADPELGYAGRAAAGQLAWLDEQLAAIPPAAPHVVVTHMPLVTGFFQALKGAAFGAPANRVVQNGDEVLRRFRERNLIAVLQGHLHVDELIRWRTTRLITGGAICGRWWKGDWHGTAPGFGILDLAPGGAQWRYVSYGWSPSTDP